MPVYVVLTSESGWSKPTGGFLQGAAFLVRLLTLSPTSASGQKQKQTKAVLWIVFRATILEPCLLYVPRCMETFIFSITTFLIFFNHPRRPVLVLTVQLNCAQTVSVYQPTNGSVHARLAWMPPPLREELREHRKCQETHKTSLFCDMKTL